MNDLPTFLYAGTAKAGSSWLYEALREHPDVGVPDAKDTMFFTREYDRGLDWYRSFFHPHAGSAARGELCHDYLLHREYAERIHKDLPDVKLVFCLREPRSWTVSAHGFMDAATRVAPDYLAFLDSPTYLPNTRWGDYIRYEEKLAPFYELFPRENILVLFYDELKDDPADFIARVYRFIGVDDAHVPSVLNEQVNAAHEARSRIVGHLAYRGAQVARALGMQNILGRIKRNRLIINMIYREKPKTEALMDPDTARTIFERFAKDHDRLESLIGRPLPDAWKRPEC